MMYLAGETNSDGPLFSVIIPAYNSAAYLEKGIASVLAQTCCDFELILVDDGSKDTTLSLCREYEQRDKRITVFYQENGGHTSARNLGLVNSKGKYVLFLDSDDWLDLNVLERCKGEVLTYEPDIIVFQICHHFGETVNSLNNLITDGFYRLSVNHEILEGLLMDDDGGFVFPKSLSGKIFRRDKIFYNQLDIPKEVQLGEDGACFVSTVLDSEKLCVISDTCYHAAIRNASVSHSGDQFSMQRHVMLLEYYQRVIIPKHPALTNQFERFTVAQLYVAAQFMIRAGCDNRWLRHEMKQAQAIDLIADNIKRARFSSKGKRMKVKQFIVCHRLFWLIRLLENYRRNFHCRKYLM